MRLLFLLIIAVLTPALRANQHGPFFAYFTSVDNLHPVIPNKYIDWQLDVDEEFRLVGWIRVKKRVGPIFFEDKTEKEKRGEYGEVRKTLGNPMSFCNTVSHATIQDAVEGNITFTKECLMNPGIWKLKDWDIDRIIHNYTSEFDYGSYRNTFTLFARGKHVFGYTDYYEVAPLDQ